MAGDFTYSDDESAAENPYRSPRAEGHRRERDAQDGDLDYAFGPLVRGRGWITFLGVMAIIYGGMACMTIIGAVVGWLPLWVGILLTQAASRLREGGESGSVEELRAGADKLRLACKIFGITLIVGIALVVLMYGMMFVLMLVAAGSASRY